jgi:hypothetical protein
MWQNFTGYTLKNDKAVQPLVTTQVSIENQAENEGKFGLASLRQTLHAWRL